MLRYHENITREVLGTEIGCSVRFLPGAGSLGQKPSCGVIEGTCKNLMNHASLMTGNRLKLKMPAQP